MSKRAADTELTRDNWDQEDDQDPEEGSTEFRKASAEEISRRKIHVAKRRSLHPDRSSGASNVFASFTGFSSSSSDAPKLRSCFSGRAEVATTPPSTQVPAGQISAVTLSTSSAPSEPSGVTFSAKSVTDDSDGKAPVDEQFCKSLKELNQGLLTWLQRHFSINPFVDFSPAFDDYKRHLAKLEERRDCGGAVKITDTESAAVSCEQRLKEFTHASGLLPFEKVSAAQPQTTTLTAGVVPVNGTKQRGSTETTTASRSSEAGSDSGAEPKVTLATDQKKSPLEDSSNEGDAKENPAAAADSAIAPKPFQFRFEFKKSETIQVPAPETTKLSDTNTSTASTKPWTFVPQATGFAPAFPPGPTDGASENTAGEQDSEAYVPPLTLVEPIKEEGATFSIKCKLFYKGENQEYLERGVGYLFLKPIDDQKTQLIVRADNTIGNIILNILLTNGMPCSRISKNNVSLVAVPNPPLERAANKAEPVLFLIRVKTAEDADKLFQEMSVVTKATTA